KRARVRIDGSFYNGGTSTATGGWWFIGMPTTGTNAQTALAGYNSSFGANSWSVAFNIRTLRCYTAPAPTNAVIGYNGRGVLFPLGTGAATDTTALQGMGIYQQNNPLTSAHPNIVMAV